MMVDPSFRIVLRKNGVLRTISSSLETFQLLIFSHNFTNFVLVLVVVVKGILHVSWGKDSSPRREHCEECDAC